MPGTVEPNYRMAVLHIEFHSHFSITHLGLSFLCHPLHSALFVLAVVWFIDMLSLRSSGENGLSRRVSGFPALQRLSASPIICLMAA